MRIEQGAMGPLAPLASSRRRPGSRYAPRRLVDVSARSGEAGQLNLGNSGYDPGIVTQVSEHMHPTLLRSDMRYWRLEPDARLRPGIVCYYVALPAIDAAPEDRRREELLLPDGYSEIVFSLTSAFERWPLDATAKRTTMRGSYVIGGRSHSVVTRNLGDLTIIGVKLECSALRRLIATPLSEFRDETLTLADLNQRALLDLEDALANARTIQAIRDLLDQFFLARLSVLEPGDQLVTELLTRIRTKQGNLSILRWIDDHDIDTRHFERRFCAWTGMTPKRFARIERFKHSYYRLLSGEGARGAVGAHLMSYYDQSHFHRDFKHFLGVAPGSRLKQSMPQHTDISEHLMRGEFLMRGELRAA